MQKLALALTVSLICLGCRVRIYKARAQHSQAAKPQPILTTSLKAAIEEVKTMKVKIERDGGINLKEYDEDLADLKNVIDKVYGDPKTVADVKSVLEGHQLALQFSKCDRMDGYDDMLQCRDNVLKKLFVKYPEFAAAVKEAIAGEELSYISAGLDKDAVLQAIWQETAKNTDSLLLGVNIASNPPNIEESQTENWQDNQLNGKLGDRYLHPCLTWK